MGSREVGDYSMIECRPLIHDPLRRTVNRDPNMQPLTERAVSYIRGHIAQKLRLNC